MGLDKWLMATWMVVNCKNGVSSYEIARDLGVTQKSAWFMLHRIRVAMGETPILSKMGGNGPIEMRRDFRGRQDAERPQVKANREVSTTQGGNGKTIVMGMLERGGKVRAGVVEGRKLETPYNHPLQNNIEAGSHYLLPMKPPPTLDCLGDDAYFHEVINHVECLCA